MYLWQAHMQKQQHDNSKLMKRILPKLGLKFLLDTELTEYTQDKIEKINSVVAFSGIVPSTVAVSTKKIQYAAALVKTDDGTKADTAFKNQMRQELEQMLTEQAADAARISNGDIALYLSTGYEAKNTKGSHSNFLPQVTRLELFYGDNAGDLKARWDPLPEALNFSVWVYSGIADPENSLVKEYIIAKIGRRKITLRGLPSGKIVFVRVRANGAGSVMGAWSDLAEKRVP